MSELSDIPSVETKNRMPTRNIKVKFNNKALTGVLSLLFTVAQVPGKTKASSNPRLSAIMEATCWQATLPIGSIIMIATVKAIAGAVNPVACLHSSKRTKPEGVVRTDVTSEIE